MNRKVLGGRVLAGAALAALALSMSACGGGGDSATPSASATGGNELANLSGSIKGSGASFPNSYYQEVVTEFKSVASKLTVTYNSVGSGTGKKEFGQGLTDFAGTDSTVKDTDGIASGSFLYVPTVAAPITISYNISGVDKLQLSADTLAKIFGRTIKTWNDPAIMAENQGVNLPNKNITVVHRSDGSGTTNNFTKYLDAASEAWTLGSGDTVKWAADTQGGERNTGVAQLVKQADGAIGYIDLSDAKDSGLKFASIKNKDGQFIQPTLDGATAALAGATVKDDLTYDPLNAAGAQSYPITAPTYILVKTSYGDAAKAALVKGFLTYLLGDGQALAKDVNFAQLPDTLKQKALAQVAKIQG